MFGLCFCLNCCSDVSVGVSCVFGMFNLCVMFVTKLPQDAKRISVKTADKVVTVTYCIVSSLREMWLRPRRRQEVYIPFYTIGTAYSEWSCVKNWLLLVSVTMFTILVWRVTGVMSTKNFHSLNFFNTDEDLKAVLHFDRIELCRQSTATFTNSHATASITTCRMTPPVEGPHSGAGSVHVIYLLYHLSWLYMYDLV